MAATASSDTSGYISDGSSQDERRNMDAEGIPTAKDRLRLLYQDGEFPIMVTVPPIRYFNSAKQLFNTAKYEAAHGNHQKAYLLLIRFADLFVNKVPQHPKYKSVDEEIIRKTSKDLKEALKLAEQLKEIVLKEFEQEYEEELARRKQAMAPTASSNPANIHGVIGQIADFNRSIPSFSANSMGPTNVSWPQWQNDFAPDAMPQVMSLPGETSLPTVDRRLKPTAPPRMSKISQQRGPLPSPSGILRPVRIPHDLVSVFTEAARENTERRNIETCGNLLGRRDEAGNYIVSHLVLPKQKGTDSYCEDLDESEAASYAIARDLIQLGWIHTHPTQSAFLSSVDLHMQWGYQMMLPEAIAIVVAPAYNDVAFFRLDDPGMKFIAECPFGTHFHQHDTTQLLFHRVEDVEEDPQFKIHVEDFRTRSPS